MPYINRKSEYTIFAKRIGLAGTAQTVASLKGLVIIPILTRTLGAADYGIWALILITISFLLPLMLFGMDSAILRFLSLKGKEDIVQGVITAFLVIFLVGMVASIIIFLSSNFLAVTILKEESAVSIIRIASPLVLLNALNNMATGSFRIFGQIKRYSAVLLLQSFLEVGLIAFFVFSGDGLIGAIISLLITWTFLLVVKLFLIISYAGFNFPDF